MTAYISNKKILTIALIVFVAIVVLMTSRAKADMISCYDSPIGGSRTCSGPGGTITCIENPLGGSRTCYAPSGKITCYDSPIGGSTQCYTPYTFSKTTSTVSSYKKDGSCTKKDGKFVGVERNLSAEKKAIDKFVAALDRSPNTEEMQQIAEAIYCTPSGEYSPPVTQNKGTSTQVPKKVISNNIASKDVPLIVEKLFQQVFLRKITRAESAYWKKRARTDKGTEPLLKSTMIYHKVQNIKH